MFLPEKHTYKPSKDSIYFGIDLGTTYTLVATIDSSEVDASNLSNIPVKFINYKQVSPFKLGGEVTDEKVASIVAYHDERGYCGSKLYELKGHEGFTKNHNIFYHWKLDLGIDRHPLYPDAIIPDLDTPAKIASKVLNFCRMGYTKNRDAKLYNAIVTVPASFQMNQRKDVIEASNLANIDLDDKMLIDEPNAAFIGYFNNLSQDQKEKFLFNNTKSKKVLIFDIGGGTCDLSILEVSYSPTKGLLIGNKAISRYNDLGGQDIDMIIAEEILYPLFLKKFGLEDNMPYKDLTEIILPQLSTIGEMLKIGICNLIAAKYSISELSPSKLAETTFNLENRSITYLEEEYKFSEISINGADFEGIITKLFASRGYSLKYQDKFINSVNTTINETLEKANLIKSEIDVVLPVGGSSSNTVLLNKLQEMFSKSKFWIPSNPEKLVAEGAAIFSFFYYRYGKSLINPIASETIGVGLKGKEFYPLLKKGSELPVQVSIPNFRLQSFTQSEIVIPICLNTIDHVVQEIKIPLQKIYKGTETITIDSELDSNKVLQVYVNIEGEPISNFKLENPFFFGLLSKDQVKFVEISSKLDVARRSKDYNNQRKLMIDLLQQYYEIKNYHEMIRLSEEYLEKFDANNSTALNYLYIGSNGIGRKEAALKALEKAISIDPNCAGLRYNYSLVIEGTEGAGKALEYLESMDAAIKRDKTIKCRIIMLKRQLGIDAKSEAEQLISEYEISPNSFSEFDVKNLLKHIYKIGNREFTKVETAEDREKEGKMLIVSSTPILRD